MTSAFARGLILAIAVQTCIVVTAFGEAAWTGNGPPGGTVRTLAIDPTSPQTLYLGSDSGVYKSVDGGTTWVRASEGLPSADTDHFGIAPPYIAALAVAADESSSIYAGITLQFAGFGYGVFKSVDGGTSWHAINNGLPSQGGGTYPNISALAVDPTRPHNILAASHDIGSIFKSTDGGQTWHVTGQSIIQATLFQFDPNDASVVFCGAPSGLYKSTDGGDTWTAINVSAWALAIDPTDSQNMYSGSSEDGIYRSVDGGAHWMPVTQGLPEDPLYNTFPTVLSVAFTTGSAKAVYASLYGSGIYKSVDGTTWAPANSGLLDQFVLGIVSTSSSKLVALTDGAGVWTAQPGLDSWVPSNTGFNGSSVNQIVIDPLDELTMYAATDGGMFKSTDGANSWNMVSDGLPESHIKSLVINPLQPRTLYALLPFFGVYKSVDGGGSWTSASLGLTLAVTAFALAPSSPATLYAGTAVAEEPDFVYKSTNGGASWSATSFLGSPPTSGVTGITVDPNSSDVVYVLRGDAYKSIDGGNTWSRLDTLAACALGIVDLAVVPGDSSRLYGGSVAGICASSDGGATWRESYYDPSVSETAGQLACSPTEAGVVFAAFAGSYPDSPCPEDGILWSLDAGATWKSITGTLSNTNVFCLDTDRAARALYAGTGGSGVLSLPIDAVRPRVPVQRGMGKSTPRDLPPRR